MRNHKTARGKEFNMQSFAGSQGETIAIGNSGRNARGDLLGPGGKIIAAKQDIVNKLNKDTVQSAAKKVKLNPSEVEVNRKEVIGADGVARWEVMYADGSIEIQDKLDDQFTNIDMDHMPTNEGEL